MKNISYRGFNASALTFESDAQFKKGDTVGFDENGDCCIAGEGSAFVGVCVSVRGKLITAQMEGFVEAPFSGDAPACGWSKLCSDGNGGVAVSEDDGVPLYRVIEVDTENSTVGFIL
ncbi:MAG: hypothetical protein K6C14_00110 [Eubacterium sp.]|nr:hypothetical protein [Eubacterium sp.]